MNKNQSKENKENDNGNDGLTILKETLKDAAEKYKNGHVLTTIVPDDDKLSPMDEHDIYAANLLGSYYKD